MSIKCLEFLCRAKKCMQLCTHLNERVNVVNILYSTWTHEEDGVFIIFVSPVPSIPPPPQSGWYFINSLNVRIEGRKCPLLLLATVSLSYSLPHLVLTLIWICFLSFKWYLVLHTCNYLIAEFHGPASWTFRWNIAYTIVLFLSAGGYSVNTAFQETVTIIGQEH